MPQQCNFCHRKLPMGNKFLRCLIATYMKGFPCDKCTHIVGKSLKASIGSIPLECKYFKESFPLEYVLKISMSQRESNWEMSVQLKFFWKLFGVYLQTASHGNMSVCVSMSEKAFHAGIYPNRVRVSLSQKALSFPLEYVPTVQVSDRKLRRGKYPHVWFINFPGI